MNKFILMGVCIVVSGCVKLQVNPKGVVADTVGAGKDLYHTLKRKRSGEEEREYTHIVIAESPEQDAANLNLCKQTIHENIAGSSDKLSKVLSESSEIISVENQRKLKCSMVTLVIPK